MFTITELPARRYSIEEVSDLQPVSDPQVGDRVVIHSRGSWREALVEKVGRTNITCVYTTEGAITEARKHQRTPERIRADIQRTRESYDPMPEHVAEYLDRLVALADRVEALPASRRWEEFVTETRKSVKVADARRA